MKNVHPFEIYRIRKSRKLSQTAAAALIGASRNTFTRWEDGSTSPSFTKWYTWLRALVAWDKAHPAPEGRAYHNWKPLPGTPIPQGWDIPGYTADQMAALVVPEEL